MSCVADSLKESCESSEQTSQKVALELQELKRKLRDQRKATERAEADNRKYHESLTFVKSHLHLALDNARAVTEKPSSSSSAGKEVKEGGDSSSAAVKKDDVKKEIMSDWW